MKLAILAVGQMRGQSEAALYDNYAKRIDAAGRHIGIGGADGLDLIEIKEHQNASEKLHERLNALLTARPQALIIALDEGGKTMTSRKLADNLGQWRDDGRSDVIFVLGAADGLGAAVRARADMLLSLSPMTWPHLLARVLLAEQLWRSISILSGHPYHRD